MSLDGEKRGTTPIDLRVVKADQPMIISLQLDGHQSVEEEISPAASQKLIISLSKQRKPRRKRSKKPRTTPKQKHEKPAKGFYRFD